ncbi:hypothetical protein Nepgr_000485 [Nepenthes gracilis]|uniref:ferroxidase n=1 Tax=Nepenthes gracilis TaxID=150966 RepID=A0AAD3P348_NEPGR|nr:hypothetical protein Nepgr_000485 [Nepenthes gracilis]
MASYSARKLLLLRRVSTLRGAVPSASFRGPFLCPPSEFPESSSAHLFLRALCSASSFGSRRFCSRTSHLDEELQGPGAIDYCSLLLEDEFHKLADSTIHDLLEKLEEYGDGIQTDGFDIDYGNGVLTLKLGDLGTYVLNKQTPNRQIWLSSPVSGPSRFDWDPNAQAWIYRRNNGNLLRILESELERLCGEPVNLS